ncbi:hypothetical protein RND59_06615 [Vibrio ruber]|uniref:hypothetical protein n=1 Tax=Vibrio ruber TaxID=184755 RepID=UPI002893147D|nr:hypothetical protein [Vibrio ruber]WNJ96743.1 hypothetical protein RND59_06615 [Vibrio ruber]
MPDYTHQDQSSSSQKKPSFSRESQPLSDHRQQTSASGALLSINHDPVQRSIVSDFSWSLLKNQLAPLGLNGVLAFADTKTLAMLSHYDSFKNIVDTVTSFSNALSAAVAIWESIPAPVKTGILFITGKVLTYLPSEKAIGYSHSLLVAADKGADAHLLIQVVNLLKIAINAANHPISSAVRFGQYLYSQWWETKPSTTQPPAMGSGQAAPSESDRQKDIASLDLKIIWVKVKSLNLKETEKNSSGDVTQEGGLHAGFGLGYRLFSHEGSIGQQGSLVLILPWAGGAILESDENIRLVNEILFGNHLFVVRQLDMTMLHLDNHGLKKLGFALKEFSIGNRTAYADNVTAEYVKGKGLDFGGDSGATMGIDLYDWNAQAQLQLLLDDSGKFKEGKVSHFHESKNMLTVGQATISQSQGFMLENAKLDLNPLTGLDMAAVIKHLKINESITGVGYINGNHIPLLGEHVLLENVSGELGVETDHWQAKASAALKMTFSQVDASGTFSIGYNSQEKKTHLRLEQGQFKADYEAFTVTATDLIYDHDLQKFEMAQAKMLIKAIQVSGEVNNLSISKEGVNFTSAIVKANQEIELFQGFTLEQLAFIIGQRGESMKLTSDALLKRAKVTGEARQLSIGFDADGFSGSVSSAALRTSLFSLELDQTQINKNGLHVESAKLTLGQDSGQSNERMDSFIPGFNSGILDFLPIGPIAFLVQGVDLNKAGLTIQKFQPKLEEIYFSAFGAHARLNIEKQLGEVGYKNTLSLASLAAGFPLEVSMVFPIFPGLEAYGSLGADANLDVDILLRAQGDKGIWRVGEHANFKGAISVRAELGVNAGSQLLFALGAGVFARGEAALNSQAMLQGQARFDRAKRRFEATQPLVIDYRFKPEAVASIGIVVKAKAFYFFNKTIFEYTAAEWRIGKYELVGQIGDKNGELSPDKPDKLGLQEKPNPIECREIKGQDAENLLKSDQPISGSGQARKALLRDERKQAEQQLQTLQTQVISARRKLNELEKKYIGLIQRKEQYAATLREKLSAEQVNLKLEQFNKKYKLDQLQNKYAELTGKDRSLQKDMTYYLARLEGVSRLDVNELEKNGLKQPLSIVEQDQKLAGGMQILDPSPLAEQLEQAEKGLETIVTREELTLSKVTSLMSYDDFIKYTTTKNLIGATTTRKTILPVDRALQHFHENKNKDALRYLLAQIEAYLSHSSSKRTPWVLMLQHQAQAVLASYH